MVNNCIADLLTLTCNFVAMSLQFLITSLNTLANVNHTIVATLYAKQFYERRGKGVQYGRLFTVAMAILSKCLVSTPECAYWLSHLPLKMSSRKTVIVNSCKPNERFRLL